MLRVMSLLSLASEKLSMARASFGIMTIGFKSQSLHRPCSGDIWMWIEPMKKISEDGTEYNLVLLHVEGADSNVIQATHTYQIVALPILLSSVLSTVSEHDNAGEAKDNTFPGLGQFSPIFFQLMKSVEESEGCN